MWIHSAGVRWLLGHRQAHQIGIMLTKRRQDAAIVLLWWSWLLISPRSQPLFVLKVIVLFCSSHCGGRVDTLLWSQCVKQPEGPKNNSPVTYPPYSESVSVRAHLCVDGEVQSVFVWLNSHSPPSRCTHNILPVSAWLSGVSLCQGARVAQIVWLLFEMAVCV